MLARLRKSREENGDQGFTLIELLVVMIIIGILAAIAIPVFLSQRQKAKDTAAKADISTIGKEVATYFVDGTTAPTLAVVSGRYQVNSNDVGKQTSGVVLMVANTTNPTTPANVIGTAVTMTGATSSGWCVQGASNASATAQVYKYSAQNGLETGACASYLAP